MTFRDLEGKPATLAPGADSWYGYQSVTLPPHLSHALDDFDWVHRIRSFGDGRDPATFWYFVSDGRSEGGAYFVGYDSKSKTLVGYIGTAGFSTQIVPEEQLFPFAGSADALYYRLLAIPATPGFAQYPIANVQPFQYAPGYSTAYDAYIVARDENFYHVNLHDRTVETSLPRRANKCSRLHALSGRETAGSRDSSGRPHRRLGPPFGRAWPGAYALFDPGAAPRPRLAFSETTSGDAVMYSSGPNDGTATTVELQIFRVSADGHTRESRVSLVTGGETRDSRMLFAAPLPSPAVLVGTLIQVRSGQLLQLGIASTERKRSPVRLAGIGQRLRWLQFSRQDLPTCVTGARCATEQAGWNGRSGLCSCCSWEYRDGSATASGGHGRHSKRVKPAVPWSLRIERRVCAAATSSRGRHSRARRYSRKAHREKGVREGVGAKGRSI